MTLEDRIAAVERVIEDFRWARNEPGCVEHRTYAAMKEIAADLRGRRPLTASVAVSALQRRIDAANASKDERGYQIGHLCGVAEELIGRWAAVRYALERAAADLKPTETR